jgi:hypothetical protein
MAIALQHLAKKKRVQLSHARKTRNFYVGRLKAKEP